MSTMSSGGEAFPDSGSQSRIKQRRPQRSCDFCRQRKRCDACAHLQPTLASRDL
ncbi:hypothetical protein C8R44DRAFT_770566 [Mycena epipterygia]|nr:hypothetical protein C8R44DRAFT_770566 [Mycena epipterygia]